LRSESYEVDRHKVKKQKVKFIKIEIYEGHMVLMSKSIASNLILSIGVRSRSLRSNHIEKFYLKK